MKTAAKRAKPAYGSKKRLRLDKKMILFSILSLLIILLPFILFTLPKVEGANAALHEFSRLTDVQGAYTQTIENPTTLRELYDRLRNTATPLSRRILPLQKDYSVHYMISNLCQPYPLEIGSLTISAPTLLGTISESSVNAVTDAAILSLPTPEMLVAKSSVENMPAPFAIYLPSATATDPTDAAAAIPAPTAATLQINSTTIQLTIKGSSETLLQLATDIDNYKSKLLLQNASISAMNKAEDTTATFYMELITMDLPS